MNNNSLLFDMRKTVISASLIFALLGCSKSELEQGGEKTNALSTDKSTTLHATAPSKSQLRGTCSLRPDRIVKLKAQVGGEVKSVFVEQGNAVKRSQLLAAIDTSNLKLRRERSEIEAAKLAQRSELLKFLIVRAEKDLLVVQSMPGAGVGTSRFGKEATSLIERKTDLRDSELNQQLAQLDMRTLDDQIRRSEIRAPFDGIILSRTAEPGMVVASASEGFGGGEVLFEVADPQKLIAACIVKESDALNIQTGDSAHLIIEGNSEVVIDAKISKVSPVISQEAGISRREFFVTLEKKTGVKLLPGMSAVVKFN